MADAGMVEADALFGKEVEPSDVAKLSTMEWKSPSHGSDFWLADVPSLVGWVGGTPSLRDSAPPGGCFPRVVSSGSLALEHVACSLRG